jgi:hypothetical protein
MEKYGGNTMKVLASCDSEYYKTHYKAFYKSAVSCGYVPHINIINPTEDIINSEIPNCSYTFGDKDRVFYSINRFLIAEEFIGEEGVLITDIDCFFNKPIPQISDDIGLFLRENEKFYGMKVAAGILWLGNTDVAKLFIREVIKKIKESNRKWYVDQIAIYDSYNKLKNNMKVFEFDKTYMDWDFIDTSYMWTGKGNRKHNNRVYLNRKKEIERR